MKNANYRCLYVFLFFWVGITLGLSAHVLADEETTQTMSVKETKIIKIEDVVVRGEVINENLEATSATVLTNEDITNRIYITPLDIVGLSPGIAIHQYKQGGTASNFIMRGFSGNSHGPNTAFFLDGIPLNEGDGYADTNIINPDEIDRVELIKGPTSALYGNYASAGVVAYYTKKRVDHNHLKLQYGAYNTSEANFVGGISNEDWDQVYSIQNYHTDGYQSNSNWDRLNSAARITRHLTDDLNVRLSVREFNSDWDAPGYISQQQYDTDPTQAVSNTNGGGKDRTAARLDFDYQINKDSKVLFYLWTYDQEFWRWYASDPTGLASNTVVGNLRYFDRFVYGTGVSYSFMGKLGGKELRFTAGTDFMDEDISRERWRLLAGTGREKGDKFWDYDIDMETLGFYMEGSYNIIEPLRLILGARYDQISGSLIDHLDNDNEFQMEDQHIFTPKGGAILSLLDDRMNLFANYSEGFALLPGFSEQAAFKQKHWDPQERKQYEVGVKARPFDWCAGKLTGYNLKTSKDFIYNSTTDEYDNVGETTREGIEVEIDLYGFDYGYFHADYGYVDATYDKYESGGVSVAGKTLQGVPENIYNLEIGYNPPMGFGGKIRYHWEDGYYTDDNNLYSSDGWDKVDLQIFYRFGIKNKYMVALDVVNLFDSKYADYTSGTTAKTYSPGLPLSAYLTFVVDF